MNEEQLHIYADFPTQDDERLEDELLEEQPSQWDAVVDYAISIDFDVEFRC